MVDIVVGHLFFLSQKYFDNFDDGSMATNKKTANGKLHGRPYFYVFLDEATGLFWMIPISSKLVKYKTIFQHKMEKYRQCYTLAFGYVLGEERAFLIQNMCPATQEYIEAEYIDKAQNAPVVLDPVFEKELILIAMSAISMVRRGKLSLFTDVLEIERKLLEK
ncbi:MAG: hypothetical protein NTZ74_09305 [Chloroflexi bacterium]|nr:hypothetical protein [Chloroflexota bacterium]